MIWVVLVIIHGIIWGIVCSLVVEDKWYSEEWFWCGFLFGIFAVVAAASKREHNANLTDDAGGWICNICGKFNQGNAKICSCGGINPYKNIDLVRKSNYHVTNNSNGDAEGGRWTCIKCNTINPSRVYICKCGMKKSENEPDKQQKMESENVKYVEEYPTIALVAPCINTKKEQEGVYDDSSTSLSQIEKK